MRNGFEKVFMGAAGSAGGAGGLDVDEVFSTQLYSGSSANRNIVNGIDLDGEGGMIWTKVRTANFNHVITDTEQGLSPYLVTHATSKPDNGGSDTVTSFNSDGYSLGADGQWYWNKSGYNYASWTWRKAPKFFDVVTYTGSGSAKTVAHSLDSVPGMIIIKNISIAGDSWAVYHRANTAAPQTDYLVLNTTAATVDSAAWWNDTAPTSSVFTVGTDHAVNANNENYVAYVFAHNDSGDGEFGPDSDQDIIKCGSFTTNSAGKADVTLNFEPQWVMIKATTAAGPWRILDSMRGLTVGNNDVEVYANSAEAEAAGGVLDPSSTGFSPTGIGASTTYIYMAIRRGSLFPPEAATEVFSVYQNQSTATTPFAIHGFAPDFAFYKSAGTTEDFWTGARLIQEKSLRLNTDDAEGTAVSHDFHYMNGWATTSSTQTDYHSFAWKRAPSFFDALCYKGTGANRTISHNLNAAPDMIWLKARETVSSNNDWLIYSSAFADPTDTVIALNGVGGESTGSGTILWNNTAPTDSVFSLGNYNGINQSGKDYIAFLFATLAGISKVGSVTHSGTTNVDCGFASGSRFVLLKRTDANGDWYVWDSVRGIVSGNDPYLRFNTGAAQVTTTDYIDPLNAGFTISDNFTDGDYIFYAIA